jgi:uncharacterized membrane protein
MKSKRILISTADRIYLMLAVVFATLATSEWMAKSSASGRWGWLQSLAEEAFGTHGYVKLLAVVSVIWLLVFFASLLGKYSQSKGETE